MTDAVTDPKAIFFEAVEMQSAAERAAFLAKACGDDAVLRARVEALLRAHDQAGQFLGGQSPTIDQPLNERPGTQIGPYKLLQQIGEGGMGVVYMAEQIEPVKRRVALKIIKPGMDTRQVIARFEAERQALSLMDHPNIAKVLDAGTTESGRPYFVMELVKGQPITQYCDEHHLTPRQRLELLLPVCQAIQHAHQKGIIHRDVKPTNILVAEYDQQPVPKVIDFGVAKATSQTLTEKTMFTGYGQIVGTLEYMSPEQAKVNQLDIDTRSDIYSLGVLLYELLTGSTPFDKDRLRSAAFDEMLRIIREEEPPKPSTRLSTSQDSLPSISAQRQTEPAKLTKLLRGELDWIVMKALEKDRSRRYETAGGLAADVQRYLADEPVQACPPSAGYRLRKFVRRNKRALATATLAGVMLLVGLGAVAGSIGWLMRDQEARRTKLAGQLELILEEVKKLEAEQKWPEALSATRRAEALVAGGGGDAALEKQVRDVLADLTLVERLEDIWLELAERTEGNSDQWCDDAYAAAFRKYGIDLDQCTTQQAAERLGSRPAAVTLAAWLDHWAHCRRGMGDDAGSVKRLTMAGQIDLDPWRRKVREAMAQKDLKALDEMADAADLASQTAPTLYLLGTTLHRAGKEERAIEVLRRAQRSHPGDPWINASLGRYLSNRVPPQADEAVGFYRVAVAFRPHKAKLHSSLAFCLRQQGKLDEAITSLRKAIELDPKFPDAHNSLGKVLKDQGKLEEAVAYYRKAVELAPTWADPHFHLGVALAAQKKSDEAIVCYRKAIELEPKWAAAHNSLGGALAAQNKLDEAIICYRKAIELEPKFAWAHGNLGNALRAQGKLDEAIACYKKAIEVGQYPAVHLSLGLILHEQKKLDEAIACYKKAIELYPKYAGAHLSLGNVLRDQKKLDEAIVNFQKAIELDPKSVAAHNNLGLTLRDQKKLDEAIVSFQKAIELDPKYAGAHNNLGLALRDQKKLDEAIVSFQKAIELDPKSALAHFNLGLTLAAQKKLDEAIACYRKALELDPKFALAQYNLGNALAAQNKLDEAIASYRTLVELVPESPRAHTTLGVALARQNKLDEAIVCYHRAIEVNPKYALAHNNLAWLRATCSDAKLRELAEAVAAAQKAVELSPQNPLFPSTLGAAYYRSGEWQTAITAFEKSMELRNGGNSLEWFFLAMTHWQLGDKEKAHKWYDQAVEWMDKNQPDDEELRRFRAEAEALLQTAKGPASKTESEGRSKELP
jgi:tetratricopeptide (TPR) repeat protein/serine/threonine protein kinase